MIAFLMELHSWHKLTVPLLLVLAALPTLGVATSDIEARLGELFERADLGENARWAAVAMNPRTGEWLVECNADEPMKPASTTKLFTVAAALDVMEPTTRFTTTIETDGELDEKGILHGSLVIRGGGDPSLGPRLRDDGENVVAVFEDWAAQLRSLGIRRIEGDVIGDDSYFANDRWGQGWYPDEKANYYMAECSALTFNDGCIDVTFEAKGKPGKVARIKRLAPDNDFYEIVSEVQIVDAEGSPSTPGFDRHEDARRVVCTGRMRQGEETTRWTAVGDPAYFVSYTFKDILDDNGIKVSGNAISRHRPEGAQNPNAPLRRVLVQHVSEPLSAQMIPILSHSQNLYAEVIGRNAAIAAGEESTFQGACKHITDYVEENGLMRPGFVLFDCSGLSSLNRVPARAIAALLHHMHHQGFDGQLFKDCLDLPGERGTLRGRLHEVKGRFRGKTGKLGDTDALAGYLTTEAGQEYIVVVMNDGATKNDGQGLVNDMILALNEYLGTQE